MQSEQSNGLISNGASYFIGGLTGGFFADFLGTVTGWGFAGFVAAFVLITAIFVSGLAVLGRL